MSRSTSTSELESTPGLLVPPSTEMARVCRRTFREHEGAKGASKTNRRRAGQAQLGPHDPQSRLVEPAAQLNHRHVGARHCPGELIDAAHLCGPKVGGRVGRTRARRPLVPRGPSLLHLGVGQLAEDARVRPKRRIPRTRPANHGSASIQGSQPARSPSHSESARVERVDRDGQTARSCLGHQRRPVAKGMDQHLLRPQNRSRGKRERKEANQDNHAGDNGQSPSSNDNEGTTRVTGAREKKKGKKTQMLTCTCA
jgi:hypothetical protein